MKLQGIYGDRMILQRGKMNHIKGTDDASFVRAVLEGKVYEATCVNGQFDIELPPHEAARDLNLTIEGSETLILKDICFGDVFLLSGQSNMELPVYRTFDISKDVARAADYPYIRQYRLVPDSDYKPLEDYVLPASSWTCAVQGQIDEMSAYGFFTFKEVYEKTGVPIGLILNAQGGSSIESWMREEDLADCCDDLELIEKYYGKGVLTSYINEQAQRCNDWRQATVSFDPSKASSAIPSDASEVTFPAIITGITGSTWFYKEFNLDEDPSSEDAFLYVGELIDADVTYVNGIEVGRTEYMYPPRKYPFKSSILHKGTNLIAVRLINESNCGGFVEHHPYYVEVDGKKTDISGIWKMKREKESEVFVPGKMMVMFPSILYKASITTLKEVSIKGIFWYQGESNGENYKDYDVKFSRMISSWRAFFGENTPVVCTVMPDYINPQSEDRSKIPYGWTEIQRQQRQAPEKVSLCYVVDGSDLGAMFELHPQKKAELGARAAKVILENIYYNK